MVAEASETSRRNLRREVRWIECGGSDDGPISPGSAVGLFTPPLSPFWVTRAKVESVQAAEPHPVRLVLVPVNKAPQ